MSIMLKKFISLPNQIQSIGLNDAVDRPLKWVKADLNLPLTNDFQPTFFVKSKIEGLKDLSILSKEAEFPGVWIFVPGMETWLSITLADETTKLLKNNTVVPHMEIIRPDFSQFTENHFEYYAVDTFDAHLNAYQKLKEYLENEKPFTKPLAEKFSKMATIFQYSFPLTYNLQTYFKIMHRFPDKTFTFNILTQMGILKINFSNFAEAFFDLRDMIRFFDYAGQLTINMDDSVTVQVLDKYLEELNFKNLVQNKVDQFNEHFGNSSKMEYVPF